MSWLNGLTRNWADLVEAADDPDLHPVVLPRQVSDAVSWVAGIATELPRWAVTAADPAAGTLHLTHTTRLWRFVDDVKLRFQAVDSGTCIMTGESRSRIGKGDLGQNARNLRELTKALKARRRSSDEAGTALSG